MISVDFVLLVIWLAALTRTNAALLPLFILLLDCLSYKLLHSDFPRHIIVALAYLLAAQLNIRLLSRLRHAFLLGAGIHYVGAIDELLYTHFKLTTVYFEVMPLSVIALNAYVAALLFNGGRRQDVGIISGFRRIVNRGVLRL